MLDQLETTAEAETSSACIITMAASFGSLYRPVDAANLRRPDGIPGAQ
jgi:hypothetical protein